jgi:SH3 domain
VRENASVAGTVAAVRQVTTQTAHQIPNRPPIRLVVGEYGDVGEQDTEWTEFVYVTAAHGSGWVPARHLSGRSGSAVVVAAYDTTELPTRAGEVLDVLDEDLVSGWLWCRSASGQQGWVPVNTLAEPNP